MKKIKMNDSLTGRSPTTEEVIQIAEWVKQYNSSKIKTNKVLSFVLTILGFVSFGSIGVYRKAPTIAGLFFGLVCFFLVFLIIRVKNKYINENSGFVSGEFSIIDGTVLKMETNVDTPGCINVFFLSNDKQINDGWFKVRQENIEIGSPLFLVIPDSKRTKSFSPHVFSNFMLTEEGIKLHW